MMLLHEKETKKLWPFFTEKTEVENQFPVQNGFVKVQGKLAFVVDFLTLLIAGSLLY